MSSTLSPSVEGTNENTNMSDNDASLIPKADSILISTKSLHEVSADIRLSWTIDLIHHMRYEDQKEKYKLKDYKLVELGWRSLLNNDKDIEVGHLVVPLEETSKSIQKKFRNVVRAHLSDWKFKVNQIIESNLIEVEPITASAELIVSIKKLLPKVNGKIVLDVSRITPGVTVTTNEFLHNRKKCETIHNMLIDIMMLGCSSNSISECNDLLGLFPIVKQDQNTDEYTSFIMADPRIGRIMAFTLGDRDSVVALRGCAAAVRLWYVDEQEPSTELRNDTNEYIRYHFPSLVPKLLYYTVKGKIKEHSPRPFFSVNKIKRLEDELGIGMYSNNNYKCNECRVDCRNATLNKCSGCSRVWYCGAQCQKMSWSEHKHVCNAKWRTNTMYVESREQYETAKEEMKKNKEIDGSSFCLQVDTGTGDLFVFCLDPDTNEVFDGLTDRPVSFLPPSDEHGSNSKSATSMTVNVASKKKPSSTVNEVSKTCPIRPFSPRSLFRLTPT
jgi:hypothetical protein